MVFSKSFISVSCIFASLLLCISCGGEGSDGGTASVTVTGVSPSSAAIGSRVTISGTGFASGEQLSQNVVMFGTISASVTSGTATSLVVNAPLSLVPGKAYSITVTVAGETAAWSGTYSATVPDYTDIVNEISSVQNTLNEAIDMYDDLANQFYDAF